MFFIGIYKKYKKIFAAVLAAAFLAPPAEAGGLTVTGSLPALPAAAGIVQGIEIALPDSAPDGEFDAEVKAESGWGVLLLPSGPSGEGKARVSKLSPARLEYRWSGAAPVSAPVSETVTVSVPELGLSGGLVFRVGVSVRIKEIALPPDLRPGVFNPVRALLEDAFDPSLDVAAIFSKTGVSPELSMSLSGGGGDRVQSGADKVIRAFFGDAAGAETSSPGARLTPGSLVSEGGDFVWKSGDGRPTGITPPSAGEYIIEASLKANLGGAPLTSWESPRFAARAPDGAASSGGLPVLIAASVEIMSALDPAAAAEAEAAARGFLASGDGDGAASAVGGSLRRAFGERYLQSLGKYASALFASGVSDAETVNFLAAVIKGFGDCGVLIFTSGGVAERTAGGGLLYDGGSYAAAPFSLNQNITVRLSGSASEDVSLWKIIPSGVNAKKYAKGRWIKEITVYTSELSPQK